MVRRARRARRDRLVLREVLRVQPVPWARRERLVQLAPWARLELVFRVQPVPWAPRERKVQLARWARLAPLVIQVCRVFQAPQVLRD